MSSDVAQTLLSAAPRLVSALLIRREDRRDESRRGRHECLRHADHPTCSETFIRIPSDASVHISELPPELIIGSGMPLVGISPSTDVIFIRPCTMSTEVIPSARYRPHSSG